MFFFVRDIVPSAFVFSRPFLYHIHYLQQDSFVEALKFSSNYINLYKIFFPSCVLLFMLLC